MPSSFTRDRFDQVPRERGRVGAHRAEQPGMPRGVLLLWALIATIVLTAVLIAGFQVLSNRAPDVVSGGGGAADPKVDTTYTVIVVNGTATQGIADEVKDQVVSAGWPQDMVFPVQGESTDFAETTVYYTADDDRPVALAVAEAIGGATVSQSAAEEGATPESDKEITVVIGVDRVGTGAG